jgi:metal-dependent hydrolase (beta-lactamase superfamily II)
MLSEKLDQIQQTDSKILVFCHCTSIFCAKRSLKNEKNQKRASGLLSPSAIKKDS